MPKQAPKEKDGFCVVLKCGEYNPDWIPNRASGVSSDTSGGDHLENENENE